MHCSTKTAKHLLVASWLFVAFLMGLLLRPHCWFWVSEAHVFYNSTPAANSRLYRSCKGDLILLLAEHREFAYLVFPSKRKVFLPNSSNFHFFSLFTLVEHTDQFGVNLADTVKTEVEPNIISGQDFIEFTGLQKKRIRITW